MSTVGVKQPDGTYCRKGASCKRHGSSVGSSQVPSAQDFAAYLTGKPVTKTPRKTVTTQQAHPLFLPSNRVRKGFNESDETPELLALDAEAQELWDSLDRKEEGCLQLYQGHGFEKVNTYLRDGTDPLKKEVKKLGWSDPEGEYEKRKARLDESIQILDSILKRHQSAKEPRLLYRAMMQPKQDGRSAQDWVADTYKVGEIIQEKGFSSTSTDPDYMLAFTSQYKEQNTVIYEIVTAKGATVHNPRWRRLRGMLASHEREVLLPRDMKYKIVEVSEASYQSTHPNGRPNHDSFKDAPKKRKFTVVKLMEVEAE